MTRIIGHPWTLAYGRLMPHHRGKWRAVSCMIRSFGLRHARDTVVTRRGICFHLYLDKYLDVHLYYLGYHEYPETRFLELNLKPGDVFFDLGANIGYFTLLGARHVGPAGKVHAFEISAADFAHLQENVALNDLASEIKLNRTAISEGDGEVIITPTGGAGTTHIDPSGSCGGDTVPATSVDHYVEEHGLKKVDYVKCDIEGAELLMLKGASSLMKRYRPVFLVEINPSALATFGASAEAVAAEFEAHDYRLYSLSPKWLRRLKELPEGTGYVNAAALPSERVSTSRDKLPLRLT